MIEEVCGVTEAFVHFDGTNGWRTAEETFFTQGTEGRMRLEATLRG